MKELLLERIRPLGVLCAARVPFFTPSRLRSSPFSRPIMTEAVCVKTATHPTNESPSLGYDMAFSENNPAIVFKDRTLGRSDLKEVFAKFDASSPTSTEILSRARFLCAKYLGGAWTQVKLDEFKLRAITGGMSNLLFLVQLPDNLPALAGEPTRALLRIQCQTDLDQLLSESVVFTLLSERNLGPKLLGVFPGGRFEQFIPSRPLQCEELSIPKFSRLIAPMLARIHTLDAPITKEPEVLNCARTWLSQFRETPGGKKPIEMYTTVANVSSEEYPSSLTCDDLEAELTFVQDFLEKSRSPIVFSHNDLQEGNILLCDGFEIHEDHRITFNGKETKDTDPLVLIDFEYCNYNYRGFDLGNHFCEYGYDYDCNTPPFYKIHQEKFDVVKERRSFCESYLEEVYKMKDSKENPNFPSDLVTGNREKDLNNLIQESILFMPISNIFWVCWALLYAQNSSIDFDYNSYARDRLALYFRQKKMLKEFLSKC